ncbi:MAG: hypothetical protein N4A65_11430 [Cohaesibacter sp.]|nr:hypothetical protein [Cohaesibacter sp.]
MKKTAIALSMLVAVAASSLPAQAGNFSFGFYGPNGGFAISTDRHGNLKPVRHAKRKQQRVEKLRPRQVARIIRRNGFYDVHNMKIKGRFYKAKAYDHRDRLVRLKVNAFNGRIVKKKLVPRARPIPYDQYGWTYYPPRQPFWTY